MTVINLIASILEITGILMIAASIRGVYSRDIPKLLVSSIIKGKTFKRFSQLELEDQRSIKLDIRGLAFICLGFFVQLAGNAFMFFYSS